MYYYPCLRSYRAIHQVPKLAMACLSQGKGVPKKGVPAIAAIDT